MSSCNCSKGNTDGFKKMNYALYNSLSVEEKEKYANSLPEGLKKNLGIAFGLCAYWLPLTTLLSLTMTYYNFTLGGILVLINTILAFFLAVNLTMVGLEAVSTDGYKSY